MKLGTSLLAAVLVIAASVTYGQPQQQITQGSVLPTHDASAPRTATGTAVIRGGVFAADSGRPLRRARDSQTLSLKLISPQ